MRNALVFAIGLSLSACGGDSPPAEGDLSTATVEASPREVHFTASDFAFEGPESIEAGMITLVLTNTGETWHHLQLVRLPDGMSYADFQQSLATMQPGSPPPPWLHEAGGVNPPSPEGPARATTWVEAGEYVVICFVDTPDRVPHFAKGMMQPLTVTPSTAAPAPLPPREVTLTLVDYAFSFSAPPTAGSHVIRVENGATQAHEIALFRFLPGKGMEDLMAWAATYEGPAPVVPVGGVPGFRPGQVVDMHVDLEPGQYVALCFLPDATDGKTHLEHGMVLPFEVT